MIDFSKVSYKKEKDGFGIYLGDKELKTPARNKMQAPSERLATEIVAEWKLLEKTIDWSKLPLSKQVNAVIDSADNLDKWQRELVEFFANDLLCYFAQSPKELREKQEQLWLPLIEKLSSDLQIEVKTTTGIIPIKQSDEAIASVSALVSQYDLYDSFVLRNLTGFLSSFILAYGVFKGFISAQEAFSLSIVDEEWQEQHWGKDMEASARQQKVFEEFILAHKFLELLKK